MVLMGSLSPVWRAGMGVPPCICHPRRNGVLCWGMRRSCCTSTDTAPAQEAQGEGEGARFRLPCGQAGWSMRCNTVGIKGKNPSPHLRLYAKLCSGQLIPSNKHPPKGATAQVPAPNLPHCCRPQPPSPLQKGAVRFTATRT